MEAEGKNQLFKQISSVSQMWSPQKSLGMPVRKADVQSLPLERMVQLLGTGSSISHNGLPQGIRMMHGYWEMLV